MFCSMSNDLELRCPVCRAKQPLQQTCRRCKADNGLVLRARRRIEYLLAEIEKVHANGDQQRAERLSAELKWLAPGRRS